jgi:phage anti-repressor protein
MENEDFSLELAQELYQSEEQFPVDFDDAWKWLDYSSKQKAKRLLVEYFSEGLDFLTIWVKNPQRGRPSELIKLSTECFREFSMLAKTEKGKQVRKHFIECEKQLKLLRIQQKEQPKQLPPTSLERAQAVTNLANSFIGLRIDLASPRFHQELQDLVLDMITMPKTLPTSEPTQVWCGVAERAEQLGYPVKIVTKYRNGLGQKVAKYPLERTKEKRMCNGTQRKINLYLVTPELDAAIKTYMDTKIDY